MIKLIEKTKEFIFDILLPKKCLGCGREGTYICKDCEIFLSEVEFNMTEAEPLSLMSVWEYEGLMEKLILKIKYDGCYDIINEFIDKAFEKIELNLPPDTYITYVPMYRKKEKRRGFNQAELIAKRVGEMTGRPVAKLLEKIEDNQSQVGLEPKEREENVRDVFALNPLSFPSTLPASGLRRDSENSGSLASVPQNVLLVDDVYMTGATMNGCIKTLKKAGVKNVWGFTLSRKMNIQSC